MTERTQPASPTQPKAAESCATKAGAPQLAAEDFYYENGLLVFTAAFHLKRGTCCESGCRHCPFR